MLALVGLAWAHDAAPAIFMPSAAPGGTQGEVRAGAWLYASGANLGGPGIRAELRMKRFTFGGQISYIATEEPTGSAWVGVAPISTEHVRLQVFAEAGTFLRPGLSFAAKTGRGGVDGEGLLVDLSWGPAFSVEGLTQRTWSGPVDILRTYPEGGVSFALHPAGTQLLRVGFVGPMPAVSYRLDLRKPDRGGFVLQSSLGTNFVGGLATITLGYGRM